MGTSDLDQGMDINHPKDCAIKKHFLIISKYIDGNIQLKIQQKLFHIGDEPQGLYIVKSGQLKIECTSEQGNSHILRLVGPHGLLGYRALVSNERYAATAVAIEDSELFFIKKLRFFEMLNFEPHIAYDLLKQLSHDLKQAETKWTTQIDESAPHRIARTIYFLKKQFGKTRWTRKEIADWAGTTPETVIRTLAEFENKNIIAQKGRDINILDWSSLANEFKNKFQPDS